MHLHWHLRQGRLCKHWRILFPQRNVARFFCSCLRANERGRQGEGEAKEIGFGMTCAEEEGGGREEGGERRGRGEKREGREGEEKVSVTYVSSVAKQHFGSTITASRARKASPLNAAEKIRFTFVYVLFPAIRDNAADCSRGRDEGLGV